MFGSNLCFELRDIFNTVFLVLLYISMIHEYMISTHADNKVITCVLLEF